MTTRFPRFRDIIAECKNQHPDNRRAFKAAVRAKGEEYGFSPMLIIALIGLAIQLWQFWRNWKTAPVDPLPGEPISREEEEFLLTGFDGTQSE